MIGSDWVAASEELSASMARVRRVMGEIRTEMPPSLAIAPNVGALLLVRDPSATPVTEMVCMAPDGTFLVALAGWPFVKTFAPFEADGHTYSTEAAEDLADYLSQRADHIVATERSRGVQVTRIGHTTFWDSLDTVLTEYCRWLDGLVDILRKAVETVDPEDQRGHVRLYSEWCAGLAALRGEGQ